MALDPRTLPPETQKEYKARLAKNYTINNLEQPFPWKVLAFSPFEFRLNILTDDHIPTGEQFAEGVSEFFGGGNFSNLGFGN